ncbi:MAG: SpvB/TcaC N-terminal domain-containing protein [Actinoplanes sp.]
MSRIQPSRPLLIASVLLLLLALAVQAGAIGGAQKVDDSAGLRVPVGPFLRDPLLTVLPVAAPQPACAKASLPAAASAVAEPDKHLLFSHDDAGLAFGPRSVAGRVAVKAQSLCADDLPVLDTGMTNVTDGPRRGYRFLPHTTFAGDLEVSLPYDPALIPPGLTDQDVRVFFFDEKARVWEALPGTDVDTAATTVHSTTNHFTDMIAATVTVPDHPETAGLDPTSIKNISTADPSSGINLVAPPSVSSDGAARVSYPFEVPPGRAGMTPQLALAYSSSAANGWAGVGWDLAVPAVSVETRWGVPRYDGARETETYLLNGTELTPGAHRGQQPSRTAEKTFRTRVEGDFSRIVRHGDRPSSYWWEVTSKDGVRSTFGGTPETQLADGAGNVFRWPLREVRDPNGNTITYSYATVSDPGVSGGTVPGVQLYPKSISYSGYTVTFVRDRELPGWQRRPDVDISARGGFKMVTADLLSRVEVRRGDQAVRRYDLGYTRGAFGKSLLSTVTQFGSEGTAFHTHRFGYHDDLRDDAGAYAGFGTAATWQTGDDDVSADLLGRGRASALGGTRTSSVGGHAYAGFNPASPTKQGSAGAKAGFTSGDAEGVLTMIDLNGDGLPDKVFKNGDAVSFRLNTSGPDGSADFATTARRVPTLPALSRESTSTTSAGAEQYLVGNAFVNRSRTSTSSSTYFSDVNADGLPDLVDNGVVRFNRLGADGVPTFGTDSAGTPVPIEDGVADPVPPPAADPEQPVFPLVDTVRRWTAPFDGRIAVTGDVALVRDESPERASHPADGVRVAVQHDRAELWSARIEGDDYSPRTPNGVDSVTVHQGDHLYFRVGSVADGAFDQVAWDPLITYLDVAAAPDVNGLDVHRYRASEDFVLAGRRGSHVRAPLNGTVRLSGALTKSAVTTDDVTVLVLKNGDPVVSQVVAAGATGPVDVGRDIAVAKQDTIEVRLKVDSPIDATTLQWKPRIAYLSSPELPDVNDENGEPLVQLYPPFDIDTYTTTGPPTPWRVPQTGTVRLTPLLTASGSGGTVTFTVKRRGERVAKHTVPVGGDGSFDLDVTADDELFLDFSVSDPQVARRVSEPRVEVRPAGSPEAEPVLAPAALHTAASPGVFATPYRGWAYAGYNGQGDRADRPIAEAELEKPFDEESTFDPLTAPAHPFLPFPGEQSWRGSDDGGWVRAATMSSSRFGPDPIASDGAPEVAAAARAVTKRSSASQTAVGGGASLLSGSLSEGGTSGDTEFVDLNGDRYPDVVSTGKVQYTTPGGGLEDSTRSVAGLGKPRQGDASAKNVGVGGSPAAFFANSSGDVDTGQGSRRSNGTGAQMTPLGLNGGLGAGDSTPGTDLLDVNGDGLPDRVSSGGGGLTVALNLGYGFAPAEPWGDAALNQGASENGTVGATLGFNSGIYDFAGGISLTKDKSQTSQTLLDLNGDGLLDRVRPGGAQLRVGFNTGNGFAADVAWGGALSGVCDDDTRLGVSGIDWDTARMCSGSTGLGGGAYFTIPIGPLCLLACYIIINPGADTSQGMAREEATLRDVDGDGYADHVASTDDSSMRVALNKTGRTNLLKSVQRPLGATISLDYRRSGNTVDAPDSQWVLSQVDVFDGHRGDGADTRRTTYAYEGPVLDRRERTFLGHAKVTEQHRDPGRSNAIYRTVTSEYRTDSVYTAGLLARQVTADGSGRKFTEDLSTYRLRDVVTGTEVTDPRSLTATVFPELVRTDQRFYEGGATAAKTTYTTTSYDAFGNVARVVDTGDTGTLDDTETTYGYARCTDSYVVGTPNSIVVKASNKELRRRAADVDCATGNVTQVRETLTASGTDSVAVTDLEYLPTGMMRRVTGPKNARGQRYQLSYEYDTEVRTHVTKVLDSFGLSSTSTYDLRFGAVDRSVDTNGNVTSTAYDEFGRVTSVTGPYEQGGDTATIRFAYHPEAEVPWALTRHLDKFRSATDTIDTATFTDGLARTIQTKKDATVHTGAESPPVDVMTVSGHVEVDFLGRTVATSYPVTEPTGAPGVFNTDVDAEQPTRVTYDVLDRGTRINLPDGTTTRTAFGFGPDRAGATQFRTTTTDAGGSEKRTFHNVRDLVTGVQEPHVAPSGVPSTIWTSYAYDPLGQLVEVRDDADNLSRAEYDLSGRQISVTTPDGGRTETAYDAASNPISKVTANLRAKNKKITYAYDFTRLERITYPINTKNNVSYSYGAPGAPENKAGRVTTISDAAGRQEFAYGKLGETVRETRSLGTHDDFSPVAALSTPKSYTTRYLYDTFGRLQNLTYPDGETLTYAYDSGGQVRSATGVKTGTTYAYVNKLEYDKFDQRVLLESGNGTKTEYTYGAEDRRLATLSATGTQGDFQNLQYGYDPVGNVKSIVNDVAVRPRSGEGIATGPTYQAFRYDDQHRLLEADGSYLADPAKTDEYQVVLNYDSTDNIVGKWQRHELVKTDTGNRERLDKTSYDWVYHYRGPQPHGATEIGDTSFEYDLNGNQIKRGDRDLDWDEENQIRSVDDDEDSEYLYDASGTRVLKEEDDDETAYVNQYFTLRNQEKGTKHVFVGTSRIASKVVRSGDHKDPAPYEKDQYFFHVNHVGSSTDVTDADGKLVQHQEYFPGGEGWVSESRGYDPDPAYKFAGKEFDKETGLYYFGSRYYDPRTGAWQSPDPLAEGYLSGGPQGGVFNPDNLNSYAFGYQNPLKYTDPGGAFPSPFQLISIGSGVVSFVQNVREGNYGAAVVDAAGVALDTATFFTPVPSAAGTAVKLVRGADKAVDAIRTADKAADTANAANKASDASTVAKGAGKAEVDDAGSTAASRGSDCLTNSFTGGTLVLMADGSRKPIEQIEVGDEVLATDPETGKTVRKRVTAAIIGQGAKDLIRVTITANGLARTVTATAGHPFWVAELGRFVPAGELRAGTSLRSASGGPITITTTRAGSRLALVHNLTVADIHTYYVLAGDTPVLVHNCGGGAPRSADGKFATRNGEKGRDGAADEVNAWEHLEMDGAIVNRGETGVSAPGVGVRKYDGTVQIDGQWYGIETKGGSAKRSPSQREFDDWLNKPGNTVTTKDGRTLVGVFDVWIVR